jgi:hypothetical protein
MMIICVGCGRQPQVVKDRAIVSGTVSIDGTALKGGTIRFLSDDGGVNASAMIGEGGKFTTDRAPVGKSKVSVETESLKFGNAAAYVAIPAKYTSPATSSLEVDLKPGENENVNIALTSRPN